MCKSGEKGRQEVDDETERRHGRFSNCMRREDGGVTRQERVCKECDSSEVEDVDNCLMRCKAW